MCFSFSGGWFTVTRPSAQSAARRAVATLMAGADQRRGRLRNIPDPGLFHGHQPVMGDVLAAVQAADDVHALLKPLLRGSPWVARHPR